MPVFGVVHNVSRGNTSTGTERSTLLPGICGSIVDLRRHRGRLCDFDGRVVARFVIENTRWHRELQEPSLVQPNIAISILDQRGCSLFLNSTIEGEGRRGQLYQWKNRFAQHSASGDVPTDTNGLFGAFGGVTGEKTGSAAFIVEEGSVRGLGLRDRMIWRP